MKILEKILSQNSNKTQIIGAIVGSFMGLLLLLLSIQFYMDLRLLMSGGSETDQYVIINKRVFSLNNPPFTAAEIDTIQRLSFIKKIGKFTPNNYKVSAQIKRLGFRTELFFESVPNEFVDIEAEKFQWETGQTEVPILISKDYLALYNFGFAPSQGLPQLNAEAIKLVSLDIVIRGNGRRKIYRGRIAGFSERINSILVPQSFMDYTNQNFQDFQPKGSSRLMILADNPYSSEFKDFLSQKGYELSSGKFIGGKMAAMITTLIAIVAIIGLLIVVLSVLVFVLNFQLIVSKSSRDIGLMIQLGYKQDQIGDILKRNLVRMFGTVIVLTVLFFIIIRFFVVNLFANQGFDLAFIHWVVFLAALLFAGLFIFINFSNIKQSIQQLSS
ncbi:MAG: hypothetical protein AAF573_02490 [Bacteroidota bacterium]